MIFFGSKKHALSEYYKKVTQRELINLQLVLKTEEFSDWASMCLSRIQPGSCHHLVPLLFTALNAQQKQFHGYFVVATYLISQGFCINQGVAVSGSAIL